MKVVHDWLKEYIGDSIPSPEELERLLTFHAFEIDGLETIGNQHVIDVDVLPNRSSDCLSHRGIAREIATITNTPLVLDPLAEQVTLTPVIDTISVVLENPETCARFGAALMKEITIKDSPAWLKERLEALGQRSINNVVDATNYVMLALGQPLHAYDADTFDHGDGTYAFGVRFGNEGEEVVTLGGDTHTLDTSMQVIVDANNNAVAGIAGIKGGTYAEVTKDTRTIVIEAANFDRAVTRKAAQKLKLQTDASRRFENEVSRDMIPFALTAITKLLTEIAGGELVGYMDTYPTKKENTPVSVSLTQTNAVLGLTLAEQQVETIFDQLGFEYTKVEAGWDVLAPFERTDINIAEDVIEEVGRVYGYEHIDSVVPETVDLTEYNKRQYYSEKIRTALIQIGYSEVITSSFRKKDEVHLLNALASDKEYLRSSLKQNIIEVLDKNMPNADLLGLSAISVFEIGTVFHKVDNMIIEHVSIALGIRTKRNGHTPKDDTLLSEAIDIIKNVLGVDVQFTVGDGVAETNVTELLEHLSTPTAYDAYETTEEVQYKPFSQYPFIARDIALWVAEGTLVDDVADLLKSEAGPLCVRMTLFDEFSKEGRTSYAFRLVFQSDSRTLTDGEVNTLMEKIVDMVAKKGWEVR